MALETWALSAFYGAEVNRDHTSAVIDLLHFDITQRDTGLDRVNLTSLSSCRQAEPLAKQEGSHVLPTNAILGLPADMKSTAESNVAK